MALDAKKEEVRTRQIKEKLKGKRMRRRVIFFFKKKKKKKKKKTTANKKEVGDNK